jgi:hypothetical protein
LYDVKPKCSQSSVRLTAHLAIKCLMANYCIRWRGNWPFSLQMHHKRSLADVKRMSCTLIKWIFLRKTSKCSTCAAYAYYNALQCLLFRPCTTCLRTIVSVVRMLLEIILLCPVRPVPLSLKKLSTAPAVSFWETLSLKNSISWPSQQETTV